METQQHHPDTARIGTLETLLDRAAIAERTDETGPILVDDAVDLTWAGEDPAHAATVAAAAQGDLTPDETLADVATSLGLLERDLDEDDYER